MSVHLEEYNVYDNVSDLTQMEKERLQALRSYQILDTGGEKDFDGIVELACQICETSIGLINFIDEKRQWFKSIKGIHFQETNREVSFCTYGILGDEVMVIEDALLDDRFATNPLVVGEPKFRFYAGMPLIISSGHKLGTLCVLDTSPKRLNSKQLMDLKILAKQVVNLLDLRLRNLQLQGLLHSKHSELSKVFDRIGEAFISIDKNWNYLYANKQLGELIQQDPAKLIGKNVWEVFPDAIGSETYLAFHQAMKEQKYICHVDYFAPLNLWQENHIYPSPEGLSVFIRNISEQKKSEQRLIESIETLERAEEQAKMGSWTLEIATEKRSWSRQLFLMFGFDPKRGAPSFEEFFERIHPEDRPNLALSVDQMKRGVAPTMSILRTNPIVLPLRSFLPYTRKINNEKGDPIRFEGTLIDITELEKKNTELDHFVYSVSHDLRAPLATVLGLVNVAELEQPDKSTLFYLKIIREHVNRLDSFIRDILDYSFNARTEVKKEKIDFRSLIDQAKRKVDPFTKPERVKLDVEVANLPKFYSDRSRIEIILNNLYSNSIKYQDYKKDTCQIKINVSTQNENVTIHFSDNGVGIEESHLNKIFNMFYRASFASKGSGLGLYIVKEAVSKLGGKIEVKSELGVGTEFEVVLPMTNKIS